MSIAELSKFHLPEHIANALLDPRAHANQEEIHAAYSWARENNPLGVAEIDGYDPFWVVTKHADIMHIGRDRQTFRNSDRSEVALPRETIEQFVAVSGRPHGTDMLISFDDPEHGKLRGLTQSWFMPNSILKLEERIRAIARSSIDKMRAKGSCCDFVTDVAVHYPLRVIMDILGVPPSGEPLMLKLTQEILSPEDSELSRDHLAAMDPVERAKQIEAVIADFGKYFAGITDDRRVSPRNDVATLLANAEIDGAPISDAVRLSYYMIIATAGHDTTSSSTSTAIWALARYPELLAQVKADPKLVTGLVEEAIRWGTPVRHFMRTAAADTELRGRKIAKGDWLMLCYASANRDEEVFERPFEFSIDRKPNKQLAFGFGAHACLGQHLARLEMRILLEELIPQLESIELTGEMQLSASNLVNGPKHLPIQYTLS